MKRYPTVFNRYWKHINSNIGALSTWQEHRLKRIAFNAYEAGRRYQRETPPKFPWPCDIETGD